MRHVRADGQFLAAEAAAASTSARPYEAFGKRAFDLCLAVALTPIVAPVVLMLAFAVWASDGGRPFFGHRRIGRSGRVFLCWKLRSMVPDAEARLAGHLSADPEAAAEWAVFHKLTDDPRVTRLGDFLRRTSLDELPQLWNVLRGDMSFVGPRPVTRDELDDHYGAARAVYNALRPGITGLWQVSGRNDLDYAERVSLDVRYAASIAFVRDVWIILCTAGVIVRPTGR